MTPPRRACLLSGARKKISVRTVLTRTARGDREERRGQEPPRTDRCQLRHRARPHFIFPFSTHQGAMLGLPPGTLLPRVGEAIPNLAAGPPSPWVFFLSIARHGGTCTSPWAGVSPWTPGRTGCEHGHGAAPRETQPRCLQRSGCHIHSSARPMALGGTLGGPRPGSPWARSRTGAAEGSHRLGRGLGTGPRFYTHFRFELTSTHRDVFTSPSPGTGQEGSSALQRPGEPACTPRTHGCSYTAQHHRTQHHKMVPASHGVRRGYRRRGLQTPRLRDWGTHSGDRAGRNERPGPLLSTTQATFVVARWKRSSRSLGLCSPCGTRCGALKRKPELAGTQPRGSAPSSPLPHGVCLRVR